jgi:hypothetical protein
LVPVALDFAQLWKLVKLASALPLFVNHSLARHTLLWQKVALQLQWEM